MNADQERRANAESCKQPIGSLPDTLLLLLLHAGAPPIGIRVQVSPAQVSIYHSHASQQGCEPLKLQAAIITPSLICLGTLNYVKTYQARMVTRGLLVTATMGHA